MRYILPLAVFLIATPSTAQTVDTAGAAALADKLSLYLGKTVFERNVVSISVDGGSYRVAVDLGRLVDLFPVQDMVTLEAEPYVLHLKPRSDGSWDVAGDMMPSGQVEIRSTEGQQKSAWTIEDDSFSGVYDPALASFSTATGRHGALTMHSSDPASNSEIAIASGTFEMKSTKNPDRGVDFTAIQTMSDMTQTMQVKTPEAGLDLPLVARAPEVTYSSGSVGFQAQPILDLLAFGVAHGDIDKIRAAQPELKTLLRNALPLWNRLDGAYGWRDLTVGTPLGIFGAAHARIDVDMDGVSKDGAITYRMLIDDLQLPAGVLPHWISPLLPEDVDIRIGGREIDLEGPALAVIDAFDLNQEPPLPRDVSDAITASFLADPPKLIVERSVIRNRDAEISVEGEMTFPEGKPAFTALLKAAGFDAIMEAIQDAQASVPEAQQAFVLAVAAKGLSKTLPDGRLQWAVNMSPDGAISVNGAQVKPADPAQPEPE